MGRRQTAKVVALGLVGGVLLVTIGCTEPLFSENQPRTQYDRYDQIRGQHVPQYTEDEFGQRHPNLQGRLGREN